MENKSMQIPITRKIKHFLAKPEITCQVVFVAKTREENEIVAELSYMDLNVPSIEKIASDCMRFVSDRENWEFEEYGENRDEELQQKYNTVDIRDVPNTNKYLGRPQNQITELSSDFIKNLKFIQFRFSTKGKTSIFCRKFTRSKILSHDKTLWKVISGVLTLNEDNIVELPNYFDCCIHDNEIAIFHSENFEELFDYHEIHQQYHERVFNHLENKIDYKIIDLEKYKTQTLLHPQKLRKIPSIEEKEMYSWEFMEVKAFLKKRPVPSVQIDIKKKEIKFTNVYAMIHFYNDSHLTSLATDSNYLAQSKSKEP